MKRDKLIAELVDDVLDNYGLTGAGYQHRNLDAIDFIDKEGVEMWIDGEDLANLVLGPEEGRERVQRRIRNMLAGKVLAWLEGPGADYVTERLDNINAEETA